MAEDEIPRARGQFDVLLSETKQFVEESSALAQVIAPFNRGSVTDPVRREQANFKKSLTLAVERLAQHGAQIPESVYEYLRSPSFPARGRLAELSQALASVAKVALNEIVEELELIITGASLAQEPDLLWHRPDHKPDPGLSSGSGPLGSWPRSRQLDTPGDARHRRDATSIRTVRPEVAQAYRFP